MSLEEQAKRLFERLLEIDPRDREAWLDARDASPELRERVARLVEAFEKGVHLEHLDFARSARTTDVRDVEPRRIGDFEIVRVLGRGGMGVVYLARDPSLDRFLALKTLSPGLEHDAASLLRFQNEARMLARLNDPAIVPVYSVGEADGRQYIAMEFVDGETLAQRLARDRAAAVDPTEGSRVREMAEIVAVVAGALEHAHRHEVVHRDVKPSNVLIGADGAPRLTDFGVARRMDATAITRTGDVAGTCRYMSPEQALAARARIDGRSDVFSLGIVLFEMFALGPPFDGATVGEVLFAIVYLEPRRLGLVARGIPRDLETICHKALEKDVLQRYQTAGHLAADLWSFLAGQPILARPPARLRRLARRVKARPAWALSVLCVLLATIAAVVVFDAIAARRGRLRALVVTCDSSGARVKARGFPLSPDGASVLDLGAAGSTVRLEPGLYRIVAVDDDGRFAESSVHILPEVAETRIHLLMREPDDSGNDSGMVLVPAGTHRLGVESSTCHYDEARLVALGAFLIDATEVSNGEFRAFVVATSAEPPLGWTDPYDTRLDDLPVVGIGRDEAEDYARWVGKRLPTLDEWEAAARSGDGRLRPWGEGRAPVALPSWDAPLPRSQSAWRDAYLATVVPVGSAPELANPAGVRHLMSNVAEFTFEAALGSEGAVTWKGAHWANAAQDWDATVTATGPDSRFFTIGFRCVRDLFPMSLEP
ncbi:MAG: SUMF1/EgtB/PvdO family nonheme iron enzyme [Planctomycetes bacterium]|nr:SUMF1/EgtB/PvdO family nonheme iron enzyme [Planctomycetota bacterium]